MKANFKAIEYKSLGPLTPESLDEHLEYLTSYDVCKAHLRISKHEKYPNLVAIDILGEPLKWVNEEFADREWYLWFESVFLVPEDMASIIMLRWGR